MSQPRDQVTETQTQIQALQSQMERLSDRILSLLEDRRPGRQPESTAHGRDTTPTVPTTPQIPEKILTFDSNKIEKLTARFSFQEFEKWRRKWNEHCSMSGYARFTRYNQLACFHACIAPDMEETLESLDITENSTLTVDEILDVVQEYLRLLRNAVIDRYAFLDCEQREGESFNSFLIRLNTLAASARLCRAHATREECEEFTRVAAIIRGIRNPEMKNKHLAIHPFPSLQEVISVCRQQDNADQNTPLVARPKSTINKLTQHRPDSCNKGNVDQLPTKTTTKTCPNCGKDHLRDQVCPAKGKTCLACGNQNHFSSVCRSKKRQKPVMSVSDTLIGSIRHISPISSVYSVPSI